MPADDESDGVTHRTDVGPDIDGVRDDEYGDHHEEEPTWIGPEKICRNPSTGYPSDIATGFLDSYHKRVAEEHGPQHSVAELGTDLGIGGNAAGIIVRRAGD